MNKFSAKNLKCNNLKNPLGIDFKKPLLSWQIKIANKSRHQSAYRILVSSNVDMLNLNKADLWDTGKIKSEETVNVEYNGSDLLPTHKYFWKVMLWDETDQKGEWSEIAFFETGLLKDDNWKGEWICASEEATDAKNSIPAPMFRRVFSLKKNIEKARIYISGLGYYKVYLNGMKVSNEELKPPFTRYDKTVLYDVYDITNMLKENKNCVGVILGNGWYNCFVKEVCNYQYSPWRHHPKLIAQIIVKYQDGGEEIIFSDKSWRTKRGPIIFDGLRNGEFYDARLEEKNWNEIEYNDEKWQKALKAKPPGGKIRANYMPNCKIVKTINQVSIIKNCHKFYVADMEENLSGWVHIKVQGMAGDEITIKYSERINDDGSLKCKYNKVYIESGMYQTDKYILNGIGEETWEPSFNYHGFRYVQIEKTKGNPEIKEVKGRIVHTDLEKTGHFECSNKLLNNLHDCVKRSTLTNYHSIPTDCPHREKNGWTGDAQVSAEQALFNFDMTNSYKKWMNDFKDEQRPNGQLPGIIPTSGWGYNWGSGPAWDSAMILIPWFVYIYRNDTTLLKEMYENIKRYLSYLGKMAENYILGFGLGDWCEPFKKPGTYTCPVQLTNTAYYYTDVIIAKKAAKIFGYDSDMKEYSKLASNIKKAFRKKFIDSKSLKVEGDCQTSYSCVLYHELYESGEEKKLVNHLINKIKEKDYHIDCGILGSKYVMSVLTKYNKTEIAYKIATQETFPGWGYEILNGATTLWERWNGFASQNHHMFSSIGHWLYTGIVGINVDMNNPGFQKIIFKIPSIKGLNWAKGKVGSPYGDVKSSWEIKKEICEVNLSIPGGSKGTLFPPKIFNNDLMPIELHENIKIEKANNKIKYIKLGPGEYRFQLI